MENIQTFKTDLVQFAKPRNIRSELQMIGLTSFQCEQVMELIQNLPIYITGVNNTKVSISDGFIIVEPCEF